MTALFYAIGLVIATVFGYSLGRRSVLNSKQESNVMAYLYIPKEGLYACDSSRLCIDKSKLPKPKTNLLGCLFTGVCNNVGVLCQHRKFIIDADIVKIDEPKPDEPKPDTLYICNSHKLHHCKAKQPVPDYFTGALFTGVCGRPDDGCVHCYLLDRKAGIETKSGVGTPPDHRPTT
jgi:hypothetical protein